MKDLKQFNIQFVGLKEGNHLFEYQIDNTFFEVYGFDDFLKSKIHVTVDLLKKANMLQLQLNASGTVNVPCDVSGEPFDLEISTTLPLLIKYGEVYNNDNEEIVILPYSEYQVNIAQHIYEMIVLSMPSKRIHPQVIDGTLESEALKKLEKLRVHDQKSTQEVDPRWDKLKSLITEKKT